MTLLGLFEYQDIAQRLWQVGLIAIPIAIAVSVLSRCMPYRPAVRHAMWLSVLAILVAVPFLPTSPVPNLLPIDNTPVFAGEEAQDADDNQPVSTPVAEDDPAPEQKKRLVFRSGVPTISGGGATTLRPSNSQIQTTAADLTAFDNVSEHPAPFDPLISSNTVGPPVDVPATSSQLNMGIFGNGQASSTDQPPALSSSRTADGPNPSPRDIRTDAHVADSPTLQEAASDSWSLWMTNAQLIHKAVTTIPPFPWWLWPGGSALILLIMLFRVARFRFAMRQARTAPDDVQQLVATVAREMGLRRVPTTLLINEWVTPMVYCGLKQRLILPLGLWLYLDDVGRRAVISHELAHLRRRDHIVCWLEQCVSLIYWWNPVVWWVRRRICEEADLCCDAWVTMLMPGNRRDYATALLETKTYTSVGYTGVPRVSLGVQPTHAQKLTRRITMVMMHTITPQLRWTGVALAALIAGGSWLVTPTLACHDDEKTPPDVAVASPDSPFAAPCPPDEETPPVAIAPASRPAATTGPAAPPRAPQPIDNTFEQFMRSQQDRPADDSLESRVRRLEEQVEVLFNEVSRLRSHSFAPGATATVSVGRNAFAVAPSGLATTTATLFGPESEEYRKCRCSPQAADILHRVTGPSSIRNPFGPGSATTSRRYELPSKKLKALTALMVRDDVPIVVSPGDGFIEVHATEGQHQIFTAFVTLLDRDEEKIAYHLPKGKLDALTALMVREDVPTLVSPGNDKITVHGDDLEQLIFGAFVNMIHPDQQAAIASTAYPTGAVNVYTADAAAEHYRAQLAAASAEMHSLQDVYASLVDQIDVHENDVVAFVEQAHAMEHEAEDLREVAEELRDEADDLEGSERKTMLQKAREIRNQARQMDNESRVVERQIKMLEDQADAMRRQAEQIEKRIEDLREAMRDADEDDDDDVELGTIESDSCSSSCSSSCTKTCEQSCR